MVCHLRCKMDKPKKRTVVEVVDVAHREYESRKEWTERVTKKMERIKGHDYGKRQMEDTLSKVEKIRTEL